MGDGGRDLASGSDAQGAAQGSLLIAEAGGSIFPFGNNRADDQSRDGKGDHENLQRPETRIRTKTDIGADDKPDLDHRER